MNPLNPFLRAFFKSTLPPQCSPVQYHILLVPTTESLLTARDRETHALYSDLASSEDFLASHVLRVHGGGTALPAHGKEAPSFRESRAKAKQFTTLNGRSVIIKDSLIYSNKGFKSLNLATLLSDTLYYPDSVDAQPWLVYYITKPLVGTYEPITIVPASLERGSKRMANGAIKSNDNAEASSPRKKEIKSFGDLLNNFPMIARQMHPGLERLFKEFTAEVEKPLPSGPPNDDSAALTRTTSTSSGDTTLAASLQSSISNGSYVLPTTVALKDDEDVLRRHLETAVTAAIDLFQMVDKQQLSHLGATTELTGPVVERMIERYVAEHTHDNLLFPRLCKSRRLEDAELEGRIRQMADVDISQVGMSVENNAERREVSSRIRKGVALFRKMGVASSPQEMIEILLSTQKLLSASEKSDESDAVKDAEKAAMPMMINADTLVSLLLVVVIRSSVRHLNARLSYMRHYVFIDDVESGETGYAISTFEAVLSYLTRDAGTLRRASRLNRRLWDATRNGNIDELRDMLRPISRNGSSNTEDLALQEAFWDRLKLNGQPQEERNILVESNDISPFVEEPAEVPQVFETPDGSLSHVFPFNRSTSSLPNGLAPKRKKRVSVASYSTTSSSAISFHSRTDSMHSHILSMDADIPTDALARLYNAAGESLMMIAVESNQTKTLEYLLSMDQTDSLQAVLEDTNEEEATLLSAAVQSEHEEVANTIVDFLLHGCGKPGKERFQAYLAKQDSKGRSVAHYLFHLPRLISRFGKLLPWTQKDKNGQTPLFALCRSYDHQDYRSMVEAALREATRAQGNRQLLHLDEHVDNKNNTLLHIMNDQEMILHLLQNCDSNVNAANDRLFTPLMMASKYGRTDVVRLLFGDPRVDLFAKDLRGLTAVELAKDDEVRNRIDDLMLLATPPLADGRISAVVRSFFVEDGTVRLILKSGSPNPNATITVTTCRRTPFDFESLYRWLQLELPASWLPVTTTNTQSPFLIPSKPARSVLRDIQLKLDHFLHILLKHPTFSTHELVWEFFLVPDIDPTMLAERSKKKAETRAETVRDEYDPVIDVREVELFVAHAKDSVKGAHSATRSVLRRINKARQVRTDFYDASVLCQKAMSTLEFLPSDHASALDRFVKTLVQTEYSPLTEFYYNLVAVHMSTGAVLTALNRPSHLIGNMSSTQKAIDRHMQSLRRSDRWPLGLLDETRHRLQREAHGKAEKSIEELQSLGKELRYTQQVVAGELASYQDEKARMGRRACRELARRMVVLERDRLEGMRRAIRALRLTERKQKVPLSMPSAWNCDTAVSPSDCEAGNGTEQ